MGYQRRAFRHGVEREDIEQALRHPCDVHFHDGYVMVLGSDRLGDLLEVAVDEMGQVFHARRARSKYARRR